MPAPATLTPASPGAKLRKARADAGLSQDALAELTGISQANLSNIERGTAVPNIEDLEPLASALGLDHVEVYLWWADSGGYLPWGIIGADSTLAAA